MFAETNDYITQHERRVGLSHSRDIGARVKLDGEDQQSFATVAHLLPSQLIHPDGHALLNDGPQTRRKFLDWGVFHVEQNFLELWRDANRLRQQRNRLLKQSDVSYSALASWDHMLCQRAEGIDELRSNYVPELQQHLNHYVSTLLGEDIEIDIRYLRGWSQDKKLQQVLVDAFDRDKLLTYTQFGPHRATLKFYVGQHPVETVFSQGQQKLLVSALRLAQGEALYERTGRRCLYLVDDLSAELDSQKRGFLVEALLKLKSQVFITGVGSEELKEVLAGDDKAVFSVSNGQIQPLK